MYPVIYNRMEIFMDKKTIALLLSITLGSAGSALAQTSANKTDAGKHKEQRAKWEQDFKAADKNGDGGLSKDEVNAAKHFGNIKKNFDAMDADKNGKVTEAEYRSWMAKNGSKKAAKSSSTTK